jgi:23S rRNA pseudouridine955/2504/2580 synthase
MIPSDEGRELIAGPEDAGRRLDRVLRVLLGELSLSAIYSALRKGFLRVNGAKADPALRVTAGDRIYIHPSLGGPKEAGAAGSFSADEGELSSIADILVMATRDLIFINKPRGELSQGSPGIEGRIRKALAMRTASSLSFTPGPLHRLDRNTTGLLTFPRSAAGARAFTSLLRRRKLIKRYLALLDNEAPPLGEWRDKVSRDNYARTSAVSEEGDEASASMRTLASAGGRSLVLVELHTGLTHQIRVQASSRGMPLSGDAKYGGSSFPGGYILHAFSLGFPEPPFPDLPCSVTSQPPPSALDRLGVIFGKTELRDILEGITEG